LSTEPNNIQDNALNSDIAGKRQKEISLGKCVLHVLLQLIPVIGIIDLVYVTNKYWKRGKVLAIFTAAFACILVILGLVNKVIM